MFDMFVFKRLLCGHRLNSKYRERNVTGSTANGLIKPADILLQLLNKVMFWLRFNCFIQSSPIILNG